MVAGTASATFDPGCAGEPVDFSRSRENGHDDNRSRLRRLPGAIFARRAVQDECDGDATQLRDYANCVLLTLASERQVLSTC
jgi:hypothetical protein